MKRNCVFACLFLSILLTACSSNGASSVTDASGNETQAPETTAEDKLPFLPEGIDYGGQEFRIMDGQACSFDSNAREVTYKLDEIETGDIIAEAVYERTRLAEEALNMKITAEPVDHTVLIDAIAKCAMSGDGSFDAFIARLIGLSMSVPNGYLVDLGSIDTLDLTNPWWDQSVNAAMTVGGIQCIASGDINYYDDYSIMCMVFNKKLFADNDIAEPYDLVKDGKWTFDAFYEIINGMALDVNGDSKFNENDFYGYVCNMSLLPTIVIAFDEELAIPQNDGYIINQSASLIDKASNFAEKMLKNESVVVVERKLGYDKGDLLFPNGQALMSQSLVGAIVGYRQSMEDDFGILPLPKYDESQEDYHGIISQGWASSVAVPVTCKDFDKIGYVLDTLGAFSAETVTEAVIEKNVLTKSTRDDNSADMLRLIFDTKVFDTSVVFDWGIYGVWCTMTA